MINLLQRLKKEKAILKEATLTGKDLVYLIHNSGDLTLVRDGHVYQVMKNFSKINPSNPEVSLIYIGEVTKLILKVFKFQHYRELRDSLES